MRKIPTVFRRDPDNTALVLPLVNPACAWVFLGQGTPFRKYDGVCVMCDTQGRWFLRRRMRAGTTPPGFFQLIETDEFTGHSVGWIPIRQSRFHSALLEAVAEKSMFDFWPSGTYELCGPEVNNNPEGFDSHVLIDHELAEEIEVSLELTYSWLRAWLSCHDHEGIIWRHPDGRAAKLKRRDFR